MLALLPNTQLLPQKKSNVFHNLKSCLSLILMGPFNSTFKNMHLTQYFILFSNANFAEYGPSGRMQDYSYCWLTVKLVNHGFDLKVNLENFTVKNFSKSSLISLILNESTVFSSLKWLTETQATALILWSWQPLSCKFYSSKIDRRVLLQRKAEKVNKKRDCHSWQEQRHVSRIPSSCRSHVYF